MAWSDRNGCRRLINGTGVCGGEGPGMDERGRTSKPEAGDAWPPAAAPGFDRSPAEGWSGGACGQRQRCARGKARGAIGRRTPVRPTDATARRACKMRGVTVGAERTLAPCTQPETRQTTIPTAPPYAAWRQATAFPPAVIAGLRPNDAMTRTGGVSTRSGPVGVTRRALPCSKLFLIFGLGTLAPVAYADPILVTNR